MKAIPEVRRDIYVFITEKKIRVITKLNSTYLQDAFDK
jgi:hypothetical protein